MRSDSQTPNPARPLRRPRPAGKPDAPGNATANRGAPDFYRDAIQRSRPLTAQAEQVLAARIQKGDPQALHMLVMANLKFVAAVCRNYQNQGLPLSDLINEGNLGLIRAAGRFDGSMNCRFISYAVWWIRQGILIALAEQSRFLRIPTGSIQIFHRINKRNQSLEHKLGRALGTDELASAMGLTAAEISKHQTLTTSPVSLNAAFTPGGPGSLEENIADRNGVRPDASALQFLLQDRLRRHLDSLSERERRVITLYFGIGLETAYNLGEIAQRFDLTRERVRQIKTAALGKLTRSSRIKTLLPLRNMHYALSSRFSRHDPRDPGMADGSEHPQRKFLSQWRQQP